MGNIKLSSLDAKAVLNLPAKPQGELSYHKRRPVACRAAANAAANAALKEGADR